jgi:hypothetical protein
MAHWAVFSQMAAGSSAAIDAWQAWWNSWEPVMAMA